jgi:hypothetical protein
MDDRTAESRGHKARQELEMTNAAFDGLRAAALNELVATGPEQVVKREKLYLTCSILEAVRKALNDAVDAGNVASYTIQLAEQGLTRP